MLIRNKVKPNIRGLILLFFIHPFSSFLLALYNLKSKYSFTVLLLFFVLFGYTFIAQNETADSFRYVEDFNYYKEVSANKYQSDIKEYLTFDSTIKDIYTISTYFLISKISDSYHLLFALWSLVFSFFFLKSFRFLIYQKEWNKTLIPIIIAFLFLFSNPITNINGVRFWTAAWIAVYATFEIVINKNLRYVALALITPLIHISYLIYFAVLLVYLFSIKYDKIWAVIFIISFFAGTITLEFVQTYKNILPPLLQNMVFSYTESETALQRIDGLTLPLYARILTSLPHYFINLLIFIFIVKSKVIKQNKEAYSGFLFLLVWMSFVNFTMPIPSLGGRYLALGIPFIMYLCLILYKKIPQIKRLILFAPLIYSYVIFQWLRFINSIIDYDLLYSFFPHLLIKNLL